MRRASGHEAEEVDGHQREADDVVDRPVQPGVDDGERRAPRAPSTVSSHGSCAGRGAGQVRTAVGQTRRKRR